MTYNEAGFPETSGLRPTLPGLSGFATQLTRVHLINHELDCPTPMTFTSGKWHLGFARLSVLPTAVSVSSAGISYAAAPADVSAATAEICMAKGIYPMPAGGTTGFSHERTCFSRPVTTPYAWEKKIARVKRSAPDTFSGIRIVRYDYHDALYHCTKRHMRLPTVEELKALFAYANADNGTATANRYAIVAPGHDSGYPGGLYGWGGASMYWSHTFAGNGFHKVVNLSDGRVSLSHDSQVGYVSCAR